MQLPCSFFTLLASVGLLSLTGNGVVYAAPAAGAAPTVTLKSGKVVGTSTSVTSGFSTTSTAVNYLGIPFAAPPTGSLRFAPPAAPTAWSKPLQATKLPPACRQEFTGGPAVDNATQEVFNNPGHARPAESEDCLYLNVYAPTDASPSKKKPVLFWIFGFGTASLNYYNGSSFAAFQDVVVVAPNYRTNIFGFINSPEIPTGQQNPGFLDQRAALQWVQENIAQFGGDPTQVTIFGESAGGYSVKQLLANPPSPLPYRAAILQSEATTTGEGASYEEVVLHFNCTTAPSQLACLRKVDGKAIEDYITSNSLDFYPNADGVTMVSDVRPNILSKKFADVPILAGTNADEGRVFVALLGLDPGNSSTAAIVAASLFPGNATLQREVVQAYTAALDVPFFAASQILTDYLFTCTTSALTTFLAANGYANTWRYYYNASFPNEQVFANLGAFHSSEIPQVWGTYDLHNVIASATPDQLALSKYMQTTWANFAKSPSAGPQWPRITANVPYNQMGELGGNNPRGETTINTNIVDYQCPLFDGLLAVQGL